MRWLDRLKALEAAPASFVKDPILNAGAATDSSKIRSKIEADSRFPQTVAATRDNAKLRAPQPSRTWAKGNPYTCKCGYATGWQLNGKALCPACYHDHQHGQDHEEDKPDLAKLRRQVVCKAFAHKGVMSSTATEHCLEWQDNFCNGCEIYKTQ